MTDSLITLAPTLLLAARPISSLLLPVVPDNWLCRALTRHICYR